MHEVPAREMLLQQACRPHWLTLPCTATVCRRRCVERFDHHCPVLGNCVGAGNHKTFVAFLAFMLVSQLLFCHLVTSMLTQAYLLQLPAQYSYVGAVHPASLPGSDGARGVSTAYQGVAPGALTSNVGTAGAGSTLSAAGVAGQSSIGARLAAAARVPLQLQQQDPLAGDSAAGTAAERAAGANAGGAAAAGGSQHGWWSTLKGLWAAGSTHMGLVLLLLAQVRLMRVFSHSKASSLGLSVTCDQAAACEAHAVQDVQRPQGQCPSSPEDPHYRQYHVHALHAL
jgi:hypothetical protein